MHRRQFLRAVVPAVGVGISGCSQSDCDRTKVYNEWLEDTSNYVAMEYLLEADLVEIDVGARGNGGYFTFEPPAVVIRAGTEVRWTWTGRGGSHSVTDECHVFDSSSVSKVGETFARTFTVPGVYPYYCKNHEGRGGRGAIRVE